MTWQRDIDELESRRHLAKQMGGAQGIAKQHSKGRLTARERINTLLDDNSLREIMALAGTTEYNKMARAANPFGDGRAAHRVRQALEHYCGRRSRRPVEFKPK